MGNNAHRTRYREIGATHAAGGTDARILTRAIYLSEILVPLDSLGGTMDRGNDPGSVFLAGIVP